MALRFDTHVDRLCFFNSVPPFLGAAYTDQGLDEAGLRGDATGDYRQRPDLPYPDPPAIRSFVHSSIHSFIHSLVH